MKRYFTLIELIISIVVIGILAAIVIPNVSSIKDDAEKTALTANNKNIQTAVDIYVLDNNATPTIGTPLLGDPKDLDYNLLDVNYLRNLPKTEELFYTVDHRGEVWHSYVTTPAYVEVTENTLKWGKVDDANSYNIYGILETAASLEKNKLEFIKNVKQQSSEEQVFSIEDLSYTKFLVSAIDKHGNETAPVGSNFKPEHTELYFDGHSAGVRVDNVGKYLKEQFTATVTVTKMGENYHDTKKRQRLLTIGESDSPEDIRNNPYGVSISLRSEYQHGDNRVEAFAHIGGEYRRLYSKTLIREGNTHQITIDYDGEVYRLFVDGVLEDSVEVSGELPELGGVYIGGRFDHMEKSNAILSNVQVWNIKQEIVPEPNTDHPNLIGYWKLNDGIGKKVRDFSPYGHTGYFFGSPVWIKDGIHQREN